MYKSFTIKNFQCFAELTLSPLERINLIAGRNNVGKTALLEALFIHCGAYNPSLVLKLNAFRGISETKLEVGPGSEMPWNHLYNHFDVSKAIELVGEDTKTGKRSLRLKVLHESSEFAEISNFMEYDLNGQKDQHELSKPEGVLKSAEIAQVLKLEFQEGGHKGSFYMILDSKGIRSRPIPHPPPFPAFFQGARIRVPYVEEAEHFGKMEIHGEQDALLRVLKLIEPELRRLAVVVVGGTPVLHGDIGASRLIPLPFMGEGMTRLASLVIHIGNAKKGVVLVDEIENGLHHTIMSNVWNAVGEVAKQFKTQVFATTHSLECVAAAHKAFSEKETYDFRLHRLERIGGIIRSVTYDKETLSSAIETGLEVR